ncbi:MAG: hypothetical protein ACKOEM_01240 [Planctomycetia bacterium]
MKPALPLLAAVAVASLAPVQAADSPEAAARPNILFISVGAVGQQLISLLMRGACAVLRSLGEVAGRVDSSLRGHRSWRSQCRPA